MKENSQCVLKEELMLLSYGRYRNRYVSGFSMLFICVAALFWGEHSALEDVKAAAEQSEEDQTSFHALPAEFNQAQIETILMSKRESPPRANRQWIEIDGKLANQLWTHLRTARLSKKEESEYFLPGALPQFAPPCYDAIVIFNDREKINLTMTADIAEVFVDSKKLDTLMILLRYDESLVTRLNQIFFPADK
tara:strand:- start:2781 stop:3359 length:579 start_codon:yes stop_codon:yes gene_type:complete